MKLFIDRLRPYVPNEKLKGKKAYIVVPSQEGLKSCKPIIGMFTLILEHLDIEFIGKRMPVAYEKGEVKVTKEFNNAFVFGQSL